MLLAHLPRDSSIARALHQDAAEWSVTDHLLATVVDHIAVANWMFASVNRDEDAEPLDYPEPVPRPGESAGRASSDGGPEDGAPPSGPPDSDEQRRTELREFFR
ncbi:hypothetical protein [Streptomyces sp. NPDC048650]|uniref:hypothetical protein n=1 Tax=unclassified Streptomyces TaxID=2593676 RepID=UPI0037100663